MTLYSPSIGKVVLVTVMVAVLPTQPVLGVKLAPGQPEGPQPPAATTKADILTIASSENRAAPSNNFILHIFSLYDFLPHLSNFAAYPHTFFPIPGGRREAEGMRQATSNQ